MRDFLQQYLYILVHIKGLLRGFGRTSFSQFGEDRVLESLFRGQKKGVYVDVGAYHPMHYSNTNTLYKKGWHGLNIEPNGSAVSLFKIHRRRDTTVRSGVSTEPEILPYFVFNHQSCNTFSEEQKDIVLRKSFISLLRVEEVTCEPLQSIIDANGFDGAIDLLNIDVEGNNLNVLESLDWAKNKPKVVCVEDDDFEFETGSAIHTFLTKQSYTLHSRVGLSSIYTLSTSST